MTRLNPIRYYTNCSLLISIFIASINVSHAELLISEIHPNPKGKDKGKEWIEFYNSGANTIKLENWQLEINGQKKEINGQIKAYEYKTINTPLKNSDTTISLSKKNTNSKKQTFHYKEAPENKSLVKENEKYRWGTASKGIPNPKNKKIIGIIKGVYAEHLIIENNNNQHKILRKKTSSTAEKLISTYKSTSTASVEENFDPATGRQELKLLSLSLQNKIYPNKKEEPKLLLYIIFISSTLTPLLAILKH